MELALQPPVLDIPVMIFLNEWLSKKIRNELTRKAYSNVFFQLERRGLFQPESSIHQFSALHHSLIVDKIQSIKEWSEATRFQRGYIYGSFIKYLSRIFPHHFRPVIFDVSYQGPEKVKTKAINQADWTRFFEEIEKRSPRDALIAKLLLQGGRRISEVLRLKVKDIEWEKSRIVFLVSKSRSESYAYIYISKQLLDQLQQVCKDKKEDEYVFTTKSGKQLQYRQILESFEKSSVKAGFLFNISPHVLRTSYITYMVKNGHSISEIQKVTRHKSLNTLIKYDKNSLEENLSMKVHLV